MTAVDTAHLNPLVFVWRLAAVIDLATTGNDGDLTFELDDFGLLDGPDGVRQSVDLTLSTEEGEWSLDTTFGFAWRRLALVKDPDIPLIDTGLRALIASVPGVDRVVSFVSEYNPETRFYSAEYEVETTSGETVAGGIASQDAQTIGGALNVSVDNDRCL